MVGACWPVQQLTNHRRLHLHPAFPSITTTGGATLRGGQLKALNQSVSTQVAQLMQVRKGGFELQQGA